MNFTLSNKASQYHNCLICKSMRESKSVLTLVTDENEVSYVSGLKYFYLSEFCICKLGTHYELLKAGNMQSI